MPTGTSIRTQNLRVRDLEGLTSFYCGLLGMQIFRETPDDLTLGFQSRNCHLVFRKTDVLPYAAQANDFYWKTGITLPDLDTSVAFLRDNGLDVPDPVQFRDIGYLTHITDPNGFSIELLQQGFEGNAKAAPGGHPIGGQARLAHITLRVTDIASAHDFFAGTLGMRLMSVQPVEAHEFCLYFYSWSDETLPNPDLEAIENRQWLWARPYTFIELQHLQSNDAVVHKTDSDGSGFDGFSYREPNEDELRVITTADLKHLS